MSESAGPLIGGGSAGAGAGRNIVANLIGGAWIAALALVATPVQVNVLGVEAFGLVGFIATLQLVLSVFDLGLSTTITREVARDHSEGRTNSLPLVRTAATLYWAMAIVLTVVVFAVVPPLGRDWFRAEHLDPGTIEDALRVIALMLGLRWPVALYTGVISGLQRMDMLNAARVSSVTLRVLGGIVVVLIWRDLEPLLWWMALSAALEVVIFAAVTHRLHPAIGLRPFFSSAAFQNIWSFALSMNALALMALLIVQVDRLAISKMLPLEQLGYYTLAYNAVSGISLVLIAVGSAMLPSFAAGIGSGAGGLVSSRYRMALQALVFLVGAVAFPLALFSRPILTLWVGAQAAQGAWATLGILACGFWLSSTYINAYNLLIASGNTSVALRISIFSAIPYIVVIVVLISYFGIVGAALAWLALTLVYAVAYLAATRRLTPGLPFWQTIRSSIIIPLLLGIVCFGGARALGETIPTEHVLLVQLSLLVCGGIAYALIGFVLLGSDLRNAVQSLVGRYMPLGAR